MLVVSKCTSFSRDIIGVRLNRGAFVPKPRAGASGGFYARTADSAPPAGCQCRRCIAIIGDACAERLRLGARAAPCVRTAAAAPPGPGILAFWPREVALRVLWRDQGRRRSYGGRTAIGGEMRLAGPPQGWRASQ